MWAIGSRTTLQKTVFYTKNIKSAFTTKIALTQLIVPLPQLFKMRLHRNLVYTTIDSLNAIFNEGEYADKEW
jgi:hypothetical protein